jgi:hypothetical protein
LMTSNLKYLEYLDIKTAPYSVGRSVQLLGCSSYLTGALLI